MLPRCLRLPLLVLASLALLSWEASAAIRLPALISDHMVLQADASAPLWGWADAGEKITVQIAGATATTIATQEGKWQIKLPPLKASSAAQTLTISGSNTLTIQDVLIGEVWLGSGQSNMAMTVNGCLNYETEQKAATFPELRMFTVERSAQPEMQSECKGSWIVCSPETVGRFSAALYFMGRELHQELKVPVGLVNSSWGGTAIEAWISMEAQSKLPEYPTIAATWTEAKKEPWDAAKKEAEYTAALAQWREATATAKAANKPAPRAPQKPVEPRLHHNHPANLFNGMIAPLIPYAMRGTIWYQGEHNAGKPYADLYGLQLRTLVADWRARWGQEFPFAWVQLPDHRAPQQLPVETTRWPVIREQMLRSLETIPNSGMAIALGLGEADDVHPKNKQDVGHRLAVWALGKVYSKAVSATSGPLPSKHEIKGSEIVITFQHTEGGLRAKNGGLSLRGFAIAGENRRFAWADARVEGDQVIVSSPAVPEPVAVRYAWADNPVWSLENAMGLPASPFRTDDWEIEFKLASIFSDHMVLQNNQTIPVWGWAPPGDEITVTIAGQSATTQATPNGSWQVRLPKLPTTQEPQELVVKGRTTLVVKDVLIGEVWLASGQSNMEFLFSRGAYTEAETLAANLPQLRVFKVGKSSSRTPQQDCDGQWIIATPETVQRFSAVAYFFGRDLHTKLKSPVGIINASWGGTDIASWTSEEAQAKIPEIAAQLKAWSERSAAYDPNKARQSFDKRLPRWKEAVAKAKAAGVKLPARPRLEIAPSINQNHPANLFNGMIAPIIPYAIRGAIWYQGEHNCSSLEKATLYNTQLPLLINDWRARWRYNLPFAWVQLPGYITSPFRPQVREAMLNSLSLVNTGMAVTLDVGEANDNHPKNKKAVGERLALWALARIYHQKLPAYSGPLPADHEIKANTIVLNFTHTQGGLKAHGEPAVLKGFEVAGADRVWKPAEARIVGNQVVVSSSEIPTPAAARYGWAPNPECNLFNGAGLPASPFRTQAWD